MSQFTELELQTLLFELVVKISESRRLSGLVKPHNSNLYLVSQRSLSKLLLQLDLVDAQLLELRGELITPYWIPRK